MSWLVETIRNKLNKFNENELLLITGQTGIGKSWAALSLCRAVDSKFDVDRVFFTMADFLSFDTEKIGRGSMLMFDEIGVELDARRWTTQINKIVSHVLQTFRHENVGVIFTVPLGRFTDVRLRSLIHHKIVMKGKNMKNGISWGKIYEVKINDMTEETYFKFPCDESGRAITRVVFTAPPRSLTEKYEKKAYEYKRSVRFGAVEQIREKSSQLDIYAKRIAWFNELRKGGLIGEA